MKTLYSIGLYIARLLIKLLALFNPKLKLGEVGRKETFSKLKKSIRKDDRTLWFHCASLGEYEQGLPVFEKLKEQYPNHKIVLSFFSPSGYEIKKNNPLADVVVYLPLDTSSNAKAFLDAVHPDFIIFVKYEIWPNLLNEMKLRNLRAILISAVFRKDQSFFKWYGRFMTKALFAFEHIFVQDAHSKELLKSLGYSATTVSGDTRFDRVSNQLEADNTVDFVEQFKNSKPLIVFGSSWPEDDKLFIPFINASTSLDIKFLIAPHNVKPNYTEQLKSQLNDKTVAYSQMESSDLRSAKVFILDTIGYLSKVYSYADIAYVGGAAGDTGLHNVLEPTAFGIPVIIGTNYDKFPEARVLVQRGGIIAVSTLHELSNTLSMLLKQPEKAEEIGSRNTEFVKENSGAVIQILNYIRI
ncbi:3-deoxy-D-manno-octulosonic acid transferase [Winogradskyella sp. A3E31]|uniref:3-deoxy-D-manno-octulosonic acid transferase n=1 Tax=Winogradskyella sp. A3E31 TaxID=3349637 RepID=UPI00398B8008